MAKQGAQPHAEMPFLDHLEELRGRLFWCAGAIAVGFAIAFVILTQVDVIGFLARPIRPLMNGRNLVYTHPGDPFQILIDSAFALALIIASPVIGYQLWGFMSPAMYSHEKKLVLPVLAAVVALFLTGVAIAFFVILPMTLRFLLGVEAGALTPMITATEYFGFAIYMSLAFGAVFEFPVVILLLSALGLVTPEGMAKGRRFAVVGVLIAGGFVTPDPTSMFIIAGPLYLLYEASIAVSRLVYRRKRKREALAQAAEAAAAVTAPPAEVPSLDPVPAERDAPRRLGVTA